MVTHRLCPLVPFTKPCIVHTAAKSRWRAFVVHSHCVSNALVPWRSTAGDKVLPGCARRRRLYNTVSQPQQQTFELFVAPPRLWDEGTLYRDVCACRRFSGHRQHHQSDQTVQSDEYVQGVRTTFPLRRSATMLHSAELTVPMLAPLAPPIIIRRLPPLPSRSRPTRESLGRPLVGTPRIAKMDLVWSDAEFSVMLSENHSLTRKAGC